MFINSCSWYTKFSWSYWDIICL